MVVVLSTLTIREFPDFHSTRKLIHLSSIIHARQKKKDRRINNRCEKWIQKNQENAPISEKERT